MPGDYPNIYKASRLRAGITQEQAAGLLGLSAESVKSYETGVRTPPDYTVALMADRYHDPGLRLEHARDTDELELIPPVAPQPLPLAVLKLVNITHRIIREGVDRRLMEIAEDGIVDSDELSDFSASLDTIRKLVGAGLQLSVCNGTKKERPDVGASKRSCSRNQPENNNYTNSISGFRENASNLCAGSG